MKKMLRTGLQIPSGMKGGMKKMLRTGLQIPSGMKGGMKKCYGRDCKSRPA